MSYIYMSYIHVLYICPIYMSSIYVSNIRTFENGFRCIQDWRRGSGGEEATSSAVKYSEFFPRSNVQRVLFPVELVS